MNFDIFENILYENIESLVHLIEKLSGNLFLIKKNYTSEYKYFFETLNFLTEINFIKVEKEKVFFTNEKKLSKDFIFLSSSKIKNYLICLKNYLQNFRQIKNHFFSFKPTKHYNIRTRFLRDFLISLDVIYMKEGEYIIKNTFIVDKINKKKFSPKDLVSLQENKRVLGEKAEKFIMLYEQNELKKLNSKLNPIHVALTDVSAGYDIKSFKKKNQIIKEVFIEVKAVSFSDFKFYFSTLEFETAIQYEEKYYIYLLPVDYSQPSGFDIKKLIVIGDIYKNIWLDKKNWNIESDGYLIRRKK